VQVSESDPSPATYDTGDVAQLTLGTEPVILIALRDAGSEP
jgi:hypothetical protein